MNSMISYMDVSLINLLQSLARTFQWKNFSDHLATICREFHLKCRRKERLHSSQDWLLVKNCQTLFAICKSKSDNSLYYILA